MIGVRGEKDLVNPCRMTQKNMRESVVRYGFNNMASCTLCKHSAHFTNAALRCH